MGPGRFAAALALMLSASGSLRAEDGAEPSFSPFAPRVQGARKRMLAQRDEAFAQKRRMQGLLLAGAAGLLLAVGAGCRFRFV